VGSIPAYAGETHVPHLDTGPAKVYPRVRGGNTKGIKSQSVGIGLSPRTRGKRGDTGSSGLDFRSIPAYAGETFRSRPACKKMEVYPRVRGGNFWEINPYFFEVGLSPRTRGKLIDGCLLFRGKRSIPAYAGETHGAVASRMAWQVYPRVRGGNISTRAIARIPHGLSPRTRGKRGRPLGRRWAARSIPAYAGETNSQSTNTRHIRVYPRVRGGNSSKQLIHKPSF